MFAPSLMTFTGAVINRIEAWSAPRTVTTLGERLFPSTLIGAVGMLGCGSVECVISGIQLIVWIAPVIVKQTLRLLRLRMIADRLPECGFNMLKILAHKTLALALQVIVGGVMIFFRPDKVVGLYDALGLQRHRVSVLAKHLDDWSRRISATAQQMLILMGPAMRGFQLLVKTYPIPVLSVSVFATIVGGRWAYQYALQPSLPFHEEIFADWKEYLAVRISWGPLLQRACAASLIMSIFMTSYREVQRKDKS